MPKVTVILTSFNHAKYLRESIDSVLAQTFTDFELIIWDDASSDHSWEIIQSYNDRRIKAFWNEHQQRGIYGINKAVSEVAKGKYIAIHHSDDIWEFNKLEMQVKCLDANEDVGAVFTWVRMIDEDGVDIDNDWFNQNEKTRWELLNQLFFMRNHLAHPSVLIRKKCYESVGLYRYGVGQIGDAEMWSRVLLKFNVHVIKEKLTIHRLFTDKSNASGKTSVNITRTYNEWNIIRANLLLIDNFDDLVATFPVLEGYRRSQGFNVKFLLAMVCILDKNNRLACQLGLSWLFELVNDPAQASLINELYSFTYIDLIKLSGELDPYAVFASSERDAAIAERDATITERDGAVAERDAAIAERDAAIAERDAAIAERDAAIAERDAAIVERDAAIVERDASIKARDIVIMARDVAFLTRDKKASERDVAVMERDAAVMEQNKAVSERDAAVIARDMALAELSIVYQTKSWRITQPMRFALSTGKKLKRLFQFQLSVLKVLNLRRIRSGLGLLCEGDFNRLKSNVNYLLRNKSDHTAKKQTIEYISSTPLDPGQPLVSVIIPCFNYGRFIVEAIDSVLSQTLSDVEIIVVDGGSTDDHTAEIVKSIQRPRTQIYMRKGRHLAGSNRNFGIERARGKYICCLDADDTLDATYLEKAVFYLETYGYDVVSTAIKYVGAKDGYVGIIDRPDLLDMAQANHILTCAVFRRQLWVMVGGYVDVGTGKDYVAEDWDFWVKIVATGARVRNISGEYLFNYRQHVGGSLSSSADVKSLQGQREAILESNREILTPMAYKRSEEQQSRNLCAAPTKTALVSSFKMLSYKRTILVALPYFLVGGAERLLSEFCKYLVAHDWRVIVISTLPHGPGQGSSTEWFKLSTTEVYTLPSFLALEERKDFVEYLIASRRVDCLLNAGSRLIYELLPQLAKNNPDLSIVDLLFNTLGHVESHLEFKEFITYALAENQEVIDWYLNIARWPVERLAKVTSGVDLKRFLPLARPRFLVDKYAIADSDLVVGYSGRLSEEKAPDVFVEVARLLRQNKNIRFIMTGAGPMTESISEMIKALPSGVSFDFAGLVEDVDPYIALYDVLVLPSRADGRPLVVMEALACGVPVIASNVGGLPELVYNGKNGYLIPPGDAASIAACIMRLAEDRTLLAMLKKESRRLAEEKLDANMAYSNFESTLRMIAESRLNRSN